VISNFLIELIVTFCALLWLQGKKVGHHLHKFGLHSGNLDDKFKVDKVFIEAEWGMTFPKHPLLSLQTDKIVSPSAFTTTHKIYSVWSVWRWFGAI
jgi:hypothetical protein